MPTRAASDFEFRKDDTKFTHLSLVQELRTSDNAEEGIVEGYVAVWGTVDTYNSRFQKGCFKKTIENRMNKIKVLWNHDTEQPIGKLEEIREDDHGLFIRAQLIIEVEKAKETFELIKGGAIDCFSFGFRTIKDKFENGIQVITEVMLGEVSPVVFEANPASKITNVRSEDFNETDAARELRERGWRLFMSLDITLDDIWWGDSEFENKPDLFNKAIMDFHTAYMQWVQQIIDIRSGNVRMDLHSVNGLVTEFRNYCKDGATVESIAQTTSLTIDEVRSLKLGKAIADPERLTELSSELKAAHDSVRSKAVESLCADLRGGINTAEATRIQALLQKSLHSEVDDVIAFMGDFRNKLIGEK